jgi:hypothetical protein
MTRRAVVPRPASKAILMAGILPAIKHFSEHIQ